MYRKAMPDYGLQRNDNCPVCGSAAFKSTESFHFFFICPVCGEYRIHHSSDSRLRIWQSQHEELLYRLSYEFRRMAEQGLLAKDNSYSSIRGWEELQEILTTNDLPVQEKMSILLQYLGRISVHPGSETGFDLDTDYSVLQARNAEEAHFYLRSLQERGLLTLNSSMGSSIIGVTLTTSGWIALEEMVRAGGESANGFIAMWFDPSRTEHDKAINEAIEGAGYLPVRIDRVEHVNRIDDEIVSRIRQSKFMVADFTGQRNGVYFEAGFMLGLGRTVIWMCDKSHLSKLHFDTRQYNMIDYADPSELKKRLQVRIEAILGRGPHRPANQG